MDDLGALAEQSFCYLTTRGRVTGTPHEIEIWFAVRGMTIYMLSGGARRSDWVKNLQGQPEVTVRVASQRFDGTARVVDDADEASWVRTALLAKYNPGYGGDLTGWSETALPVAVDLA